jgi:hypothetical protein
MRRRVLNRLTLLSALLCAAVVASWVRNWHTPGPVCGEESTVAMSE